MNCYRDYPKLLNCHGSHHFECGLDIEHCMANSIFMARELTEVGILVSFLGSHYSESVLRPQI